MITLITGAPGTGKSNALVSLLESIGKDRAIYVFGIPELKIPHIELPDPSTWPDTVPDGSAIILDEVQNVWRPRGPGQKVPEHVAKLETHRHRGLDFYIITQGPNLVDANVRALVGRHIHLRDLGILGRWWYEWPECADNCRTGWKNAPIKKRYKLDKAAQAKYKSASIHVKPVRSVPWMLAVMVLALCIVAFMSWRAYGMISAKVNPPKPAATAVASGQVNGATGTQAATASEPKTIDDRIAWIPRISHRPESAPAFDELRKVVAMPVVSGAICNSKGCRCVTQQGTNAGLSDAECRKWLENPPFDPYSVAKAEQAPSPSVGRENAAEARPAPGMVLIEAPGYRDPVGARSSSR
ncbi:zona occludens toxin [Variovorax boronicumulans]|uniref:Zona occludens toxin n=1 Tax=Variovorax boronicumulans TaxID=436515 RepID=A0AAW8DU99_9BURK|nr:zonular occludens toxin domain-containing protein [Variovorax boronicumulans]MDP9877602.1 zona occludens toxin [Variovorax boronicumulans]MDP9922887.1 zona occludens toxin [Variovorax boronicumulans]